MPQTAFYSLNNDVPGALLVGAALCGLLSYLLSAELKGYTFCVLTGLAVAAALLTKLSNHALVPLLVIAILQKLRQANSKGTLRRHLSSLGALAACSAL